MTSLTTQDEPGRKFGTSPQVPRIRPVPKEDWFVEPAAQGVRFGCRLGGAVVGLTIDVQCAAWLQGTLRVHAARAGRLAGGPGGRVVRDAVSAAQSCQIPPGFLGRAMAPSSMMERTDWAVEHRGELVVLKCTQRGETFAPLMEAETAAWLSARLHRVARTVRRALGMGGIRTVNGILSNAEDDYRLNLEKDR